MVQYGDYTRLNTASSSAPKWRNLEVIDLISKTVKDSDKISITKV